MKRALAPVALLGLSLGSTAAFAIPCQEVANMLNAGVPANIVASAVRDSGAQYTASDIACLSKAGAPASVLTVARGMTAAPEPAPAAAPTPRAQPTGIDSEDDLIGSRSRAKRRTLEDAGGDTETASAAASPNAVKEAVRLMRNNKPLSASLRFYDLLKSGNFPAEKIKIEYYLARSLEQLEMYHTAQYYFLKVVKQGPNTPYFKYALPKLVKMAQYTGDETELLKIAPKVPAESYPRGSKNQMYYLMGIRSLASNELNDARKYLGQVSSKSTLYRKARYLEGIIYNKQGKLKSAKRAFMDVVRHPFAAKDKAELAKQEHLMDLALINIGRMYYKIERFDDASKYFDLVRHESAYWPEALFSGAWSNFMQNNLNHTLGQLLTVRSPFYNQDDYIPEIEYLRALTFFNLCEYKEVETILLAFEERTRPVQQELKDFVKGYSSKEQLKLAEQAWDTYFGPTPAATNVPKPFFSKLLRNEDISGMVTHMELLDSEIDLINQQKPEWRDTVGALMKKIIERDRQKLKRRAGKFMLAEMARWANNLQDLLSSSEIVRFEVIDAQRVDYQYKFQNPDLANLSGRVDLDFATATDFIYWPFNGEFWRDELGYYHYTEQGSCK